MNGTTGMFLISTESSHAKAFKPNLFIGTSYGAHTVMNTVIYDFFSLLPTLLYFALV